MATHNFDFDIQILDLDGENLPATGSCVVTFTISRPDPSVGIFRSSVEVSSVSDIKVCFFDDAAEAPLANDHPLRQRVIDEIVRIYEDCWSPED